MFIVFTKLDFEDGAGYTHEAVDELFCVCDDYATAMDLAHEYNKEESARLLALGNREIVRLINAGTYSGFARVRPIAHIRERDVK